MLLCLAAVRGRHSFGFFRVLFSVSFVSPVSGVPVTNTDSLSGYINTEAMKNCGRFWVFLFDFLCEVLGVFVCCVGYFAVRRFVFKYP